MDSHLEIHVTHSTPLAVTIHKLQTTFTALVLPEIIVSDNGTSFTSQEFQILLKLNGIQHVRMSPYRLSSNGLAEWYVYRSKL